MAHATFRIWRGDSGGGEFRDYQAEISDGMVVLERMSKMQGLTLDFRNPGNFPFPHLIHANHDGDPNMILFGIGDLDALVTGFGRLSKLGVHRDRQPFLFFLLKLMEGSHGLFIRHPRNHPVRSLVIKLNEVKMGVDL